MPLFLITGLPGSGKSTVYAELKSRGYEAYDGDEDKLAKWYDSSGQEVPDPPVNERNDEFIHAHTRDIARPVVQSLATKAEQKPVFLCSDPENEAELRDLFSKVFSLFVDEATLKHRLATRTNNTWGKAPQELKIVLASQQKAQDTYKKLGYAIINSTQPVEDVVDQIIMCLDSSIGPNN